MPLQIRRGTQAERDQLVVANVPLAEGEPLWETTNKKLYVGDGVTAGGVLLETAVDLSDYEGIIGADGFAGPVYAVDSTVLVDYTNGSINLSGTVKGDIIPDADQAYDLGSVSRRFKDLWLSGNSLWLGDAQITASGTTVDLPAGSTINGNPVGGGVVDGNNYRINILGSDSSVIVDSTTGTLNGNLFGDVVGSVFSSDSTILVDSSNSVLSNGVLRLEDDFISSSTAKIVFSDQDLKNPIELRTITYQAPGGIPYFSINSSKGTTAAPEDTEAGAPVNGMYFKGYANGQFRNIGGILTAWDSSANLTDDYPSSTILITNNSNSNLQFFGFTDQSTFNTSVIRLAQFTPSEGSGSFEVFADSSERDSAIPTPTPGMITYIADDGTGNPKFQGYVGNPTNAWVNFH